MKKINKKLFVLLVMIVCLFGFIWCNINVNNTKNLLSLGISTEIPKNMKFGYSCSKMFNYNETLIPSVVTQCIDKKGSILFKSFPFTTEDYMNHFKSAFSSENIEELKYDYKEINIKNDSIEKVYKSKAILRINEEKKYSYVYLISFKNSSGTLIIETISNKNKDYENVIKSLSQVKSNIGNIKYIEGNKAAKQQDISIVEDISIKMPKDYEIKKSTTGTEYYINGFGNNEAMYVIASKKKPISTNNLVWSNINGYEVLKKYDDNNYLIHDYNTQLLYTLNTEVKEYKSYTGNTYYLRIESLTQVKKNT